MRVAQLGLFIDTQIRPPNELLDEWHALTAIADSVASVGTAVSVIQASMIQGHVKRSGIDYDFIAPEKPDKRVTQSPAFCRLIEKLRPDVLHVHGLGFSREVIDLASRYPELPILLQDHADRPPRIWRRRVWQRAFLSVHGITFCALAQAEPFRRAGLLRTDISIFEIPESTSYFTPGDKKLARVQTGISGDPAILAVAHLNDNKDPLAVLDGVSAAAEEMPGLQLWWCFASAPRLSAVQAQIRKDPKLHGRVHLLGKVPHGDIEQLMRAADIFVLGSHSEGGSFSLIEALATGLIPVVTDIPSNRSLTGDGAIGELWARGNSVELARALVKVNAHRRSDARAEVLTHFRERLSREALGRQFTRAYLQLTDSHRSRRAGIEQ